MAEPEDRFFESMRLKLHYAVWGDESKPPLLLVHGGRDHARSWDFVAAAMTDRFAVYAPDLRGHGDSDWTVGGQYRISDHVIDLTKLIDTIDRGPVDIIAHSMGGRVSLDLTAAFPNRVRRLIAIEGFGWPLRSERPAEERMRGLVKAVREIEDGESRIYKTFADAEARMQEANKRLAPEMVRHLTKHAVRRREDGSLVWKFDPYVYVQALPDWTQEELMELWRRIEAPVLLIGGAENWPRQPLVRELSEALPNARTVIVENAAHWVHHDQLDEFVRLAREFLS
jgi:pimeloyl-ACP methyl ester carboxylesterase